jgi:hypothetical protein
LVAVGQAGSANSICTLSRPVPWSESLAAIGTIYLCLGNLKKPSQPPRSAARSRAPSR